MPVDDRISIEDVLVRSEAIADQYAWACNAYVSGHLKYEALQSFMSSSQILPRPSRMIKMVTSHG